MKQKMKFKSCGSLFYCCRPASKNSTGADEKFELQIRSLGPNQSNHARLSWRSDHLEWAENHLIINDTTKCGRGADAGAGAGRTCAVAPPGRWRCQAVSAMLATRSRTWGAERERSASTHAAQVQNGKLCMRAKRSSALRRFRIYDIDNNISIATPPMRLSDTTLNEEAGSNWDIKATEY
eukprot:2435298-Pleurochrysis_carterae.AAC.5